MQHKRLSTTENAFLRMPLCQKAKAYHTAAFLSATAVSSFACRCVSGSLGKCMDYAALWHIRGKMSNEIKASST